jgi:hypothetical protein
MNIPNFVNIQLVDKNGYLTDSARQMFEELFDVLQANLSDESIVTPEQPASKISLLNGDQYKGGLLYNSDTNKLMVNENGTFKTVQTV